MTSDGEGQIVTEPGTAIRRRVTVEGIVQGVGFRPHVHRLARELGLAGRARNFAGGLEVEIEGPQAAVQQFVERIESDAPPIAVIESLETEELPAAGDTQFEIVASREGSEGEIYVSPDVAVCEDCRREMADEADRRFRHPFINCTNCGPRFTIIEGVPYDRPKTSMSEFEMCAACRREYEDINDRRYHAQPVACPECGPRLLFVSEGCREERAAALAAAQQMLSEGCIVAVKGLGGFHLACDADDDQAVRRLRRRKSREAKPLAVMTLDLQTARRFAHVSEQAETLMSGPEAPIVLLPRRREAPLAESIAPDTDTYGVLLPYTPLHILLLEGLDVRALVMTSGNLSDEPLATDNQEAMERLSDIVDGFLMHDRDIFIGCDDSVLRPTQRSPVLMRRSRGYVPFPVRLSGQMRPILAVGGHLKNTFCITRGRNAFLSQHIGDLEDLQTLEYFQRSVAHFEKLLQVTPEGLACDLHPDYLSTRYAEELAEERHLPLERVQHHHAHLAAVLADNHLEGPAVGLLCDGTGYGADGTVWGCEVLVGDAAHYQRAGHLRPIPLPGGEAAIHEPWRVAAAWLAETFGPEWSDELAIAFAERIDRQAWATLQSMIERGVNCPPASSAGRLFDAAAALVGLFHTVEYEAQAPTKLEAIAERGVAPYPHEIEVGEGAMLLDPRVMIRAMADDLREGVPASVIAGRFHLGFAQMLADAAERACQANDLELVGLSGGTFQNRIVLEELMDELERRGLRPVMHRATPPGDGCLALGQAAVAQARWQ
ncbi:MAG: carbamoyltransferase HypF [Armatimonadota bacterium]|nr:carbamoyltransferase HypF [Armatimonadota bacterium]